MLGTRLRAGRPTMEWDIFDEETKERLLNATLGPVYITANNDFLLRVSFIWATNAPYF